MDERFVDPDEPTLTGVLKPVGGRGAELAAAMRADPAGRTEVEGAAVAPARLFAAWWTDPAGRRHVRLYNRQPEDEELDAPDVCRVYPGVWFRVAVGEDEQVLAVCGCGAVGLPEALGWAGDRCGPCADAQMEGRSVPPPVVQYGLANESAAVRFSADGHALVTAGRGNRLLWLDRRTGERVLSEPARGSRDRLVGLAVAPDGRAVMAGFWSNQMVGWEVVPNRLSPHGEQPAFSSFVPSPDGRFFVCNWGMTLDRIPWGQPGLPLQRWAAWPGVRGGGFNRAGTRWVALADDLSFAAFDLTMLTDPPNPRHALPDFDRWDTAGTVREDVFAGLDPSRFEAGYFFDHIGVLAIDPDHDHVVVGVDDPEHGGIGPAWLGGVAEDKGWRPLPIPEAFAGELPTVHGFTPDGAWLLYSYDAVLHAFPTAPDREPVAVRGLGETTLRPGTIACSPDGETLACHVPDGGLLWVLPWRRLLGV